MKFLAISGAALLLLASTGCLPPPEPPRSQLAIRQDQTREFDTGDTKLVMKAVLNALQDEGFVTKNAVVDLGLITATREVDLEDSTAKIFGRVLMGDDATWEKSSVVEATMNVTPFGKGTRLRASFQRKVVDNRGNTVSIEDVRDPKFYQDFFSKVDKSIFLQRQRI